MNLIRKIMIMLFLLVALFTAGMSLMSWLNLHHSQAALSKLRLKQIEEAFYGNFEHIIAQNHLLEQNAEKLALLGELFYAMHQRDDRNYDVDLYTYLHKNTAYFSEAIGSGIWFEPNTYEANKTYSSLYAFWDGNQKQAVVTQMLNTAEYDYHNKSWYRAAIPADWPRNKRRPNRYYWSAAHANPVLDTVIITVSVPMYSNSGEIIGVATTDWAYNKIINLVSDVNITENSFSFLINQDEQKLSSLSQEESRDAQSLLAALSLKEFADYTWTDKYFDIWRETMKTREIIVDGRQYSLFFDKTSADMIFGIVVPTDEIYAVIEEMLSLNLKVVSFTILVLLILAAFILYTVAGIMRLLDTLYTDSLTGLPNRIKLVQDIRHTRREALIIANIDYFKEVNDFYGQQCGDNILKTFGERIQQFMEREKMTLKGCTRLYKMPSDEFAILVLHQAAERPLQHYLSTLSKFVAEQLFEYQGHEITLSATLGIAVNSRLDASNAVEGEMFISSANMALKLAKEQKKNSVIYDKSMKVREQYEQNMIWAQKLKKAIQEDRLVPYFQPIVNNIDGKIEKFECLARLIEEDDNIVSPYYFLNIAKKVRLYQQITRIMVSKSFAAFSGSGYELSINLSYEDIINKETTDYIKQQLQHYDIADQVFFEVLESESIDNYEHIYEFIKEIKKMGCRVSIDDFGTGYSNFDHLLKLNADILKVDGSLIKDIDHDRNALIITEGIVGFAKKLNIKTVAEFVHSQAVLDKVIDIGIDYSQGFFLGKPASTLPVDNIVKLVKKSRERLKTNV